VLRRRHIIMAVFASLSLAAVPASAQNPDSLLARMTLEEKLGQLNLLSAGGKASPQQLDLARRGLLGGLFNVIGTENTQAANRVATTESRLKIPLLFGLDVIHGFRTTFPIPLAEAGAFDPELAEATARAAGREAAAAGINWTYAPMVDIAHDPRWGRIAEGSGEDPYLGSLLAAARVRGFQESILATAKHFAAYGAAEAGRDYNTSDISERTLREVYFPPFKAAIDAGVATLMSAFNDIGGVPASGNAWLTDTVLRREWKFNGMVVSDWTSVAELIPHGIAGTRAEAGRRALTAGVDMDMQSSIYVETLAPLVQSGRIPMAVVDEAVRRVLRAKARAAQLRPVAPNPVEIRALARRAARESIVLLKNERVGRGAACCAPTDTPLLPLDKASPAIAVIGPLADNQLDALGPWHTEGKPEDVVTVLAGIKSRVPSGTQVLYAQGAGIEDTSTAGFADAIAAARRAKVAILVLGERHDMSGEAASRSSLGLPGVQQQLLEAVSATGTPVVLVLMNGRPLVLEWAAEHVPAIVETWYLGVEAGNATAEVLFGDFNPSGRLTTTFPRSVGQIPLYYNHRNTGRPPAADKFTSKYIDVPVTPRYPFGYGLSYTTFAYRDLKLSSPRIGPTDTVKVTVTVANTGTREGTEIVQLYVRDEVGSVARPVRELKGFRRITLKPGESRPVELRLAAQDLAFYGLDMKRVVEAGTFRVFVGPNSIEGLEGTFEVAYP
jgi:beta-glucosidase